MSNEKIVSLCWVHLSCMSSLCVYCDLCCSDLDCFFFFNDTATTEIYTLSLHDALPIWGAAAARNGQYKKRGRCRNEKWAV